MRMKRVMMIAALAAILGGLCSATAQAAVSVTDVKAVQRYPWNGMVDIDYTVVCDDANADVWVCPNGVDTDRGNTIPMLTLTGDGAGAAVKAGKHRMTWDAAKDAPGYNTQNFKVTMTAVSGASLYIVVDLSGGPSAESYPVRSSATGPDLSDDACRTTNLWLRLIPPGTFTMGERATDYPDLTYSESLHAVTISKPFYIGVFEVTQKQYQLVTGKTPSFYSGDARPVENVSYNDLRGTLNGASWPKHGQVDADSFFGILRSKTALNLDLPTEAQWEYACRAGTTTALNNGKDLENALQDPAMAEVGRYAYNSGDSGSSDGKGGYSYHTKVGMYRANAWGLYDMHGNVWEWCLDWYGNYATGSQTDPVGVASGSYRALCGGSWYNYAGGCRSASRTYYYPSSRNYYDDSYGFRLCCSAGQ